MSIKQKDIQMYSDNPIEFIRAEERDLYSMDDSYSPKIEATSLLY